MHAPIQASGVCDDQQHRESAKRVDRGEVRQFWSHEFQARIQRHYRVGITDAWPLTHRQAPSLRTQTFVNRDARSKGLPSLSLPASL